MSPSTAPDAVTGGRILTAVLEMLGVRQVFGIPGGQTLAITDAIFDSPSIRLVTTRHEGAAACMADAAGRLTGRPGVCLATTGPGATNLLTGVGGAMRDSSPVLVLTCNNFNRDLGRDDAQAADHVSIFRPLTKSATLVSDPSLIPQVITESYLRAVSGCPGPVLVDLTRDAVESTVSFEFDAISSGLRRAVEQTLHARPHGDPTQIAQIAEALVGAEAPVLWLGNGARQSGAGESALELARALDAPVITTFNGMGVVRTADANVFGPLSRMGTALSSKVVDGADVLVVVGNSLNGPSTGRWSMTLPPVIFQIDVESSQLGRSYGSQTTGVIGDARAVIEQISSAIDEKQLTGPLQDRRHRRLEWLRSEKERWRSAARAGTGRPGAIDPSHVIHELRSLAPDDTLLVVDAGNPGVWTHLWEIREPGTYMKPVGFGNMGFALPAAIAAKIVDPSRPVVALLGDGSLGMTLAELETLAREGPVVLVVLLNDLGYGNIRQEEIMKYGPRTIGVDFADVDYAAVARACGIPAARVDEPTQLNEALAAGFDSGGPYLVDVRIDPDLSVWNHPLFQSYDAES